MNAWTWARNSTHDLVVPLYYCVKDDSSYFALIPSVKPAHSSLPPHVSPVDARREGRVLRLIGIRCENYRVQFQKEGLIACRSFSKRKSQAWYVNVSAPEMDVRLFRPCRFPRTLIMLCG